MSSDGESRLVIGVLAIGTAVSFGFVIAERSHGSPMLPPALFRSRAFMGAILGAFLYYFAYYGALFVLSLALQTDVAVSIEVGLKFASIDPLIEGILQGSRTHDGRLFGRRGVWPRLNIRPKPSPR
ncbi:hypothetical protein A3731_16850 [Roseovarius sp. HI0049]|nr:hypothetical protein A3731_16850 [Roseovarius sp. HI0049]